MGKTVTICFTNNKGGSGKSTTCSTSVRRGAVPVKKVLLGGWRYAAESVACIFFGGLGA